MHFDIRGVGNKPTPNRTLIKLLKSPGLMVSASGISTIFFYHVILMKFVIN